MSAPAPASRAELLHVLMLPDLERAKRIGEYWSYPQSDLSDNSTSVMTASCERVCRVLQRARREKLVQYGAVFACRKIAGSTVWSRTRGQRPGPVPDPAIHEHQQELPEHR